ncbi:MAG: hypothetical protein NXI14_04410 [bacterium]|nr:hypothetical protein [bacterium]
MLRLHAGSLFAIARNAAQASQRTDDREQTLIAVVFAVLALEAFLNETAMRTNAIAQNGQDPTLVSTAATLLNLEESRESLLGKLRRTHEVLCGTELPKGSDCYQRIRLCVKLRDSLVHLKPSGVLVNHDDRQENVIRELNQRSLFGGRTVDSFLVAVSTPEIALFCINAVSDAIRPIMSSFEQLPEAPRFVEAICVKELSDQESSRADVLFPPLD